MTVSATRTVALLQPGSRGKQLHRSAASVRRRRRHSAHRVLARYVALAGGQREVVAIPGAAGCVLVVDRDPLTQDDARLVAHIAADEPPENASIAGALFARQAGEQHVRCRPLVAKDLTATSSAEYAEEEPPVPGTWAQRRVCDGAGRAYRLEAAHGQMSIPELRWRRYPAMPNAIGARPATVSVREAIEGMQAYEPVRALTRLALATHANRRDVSIATLRLELTRVLRSPIVLNGKLRDTVLRMVGENELSMSEIAIRCGRVKRDSAGNISGETSWLARRLGLLAEGGREHPTPWIHSEVLALIARRGLGVSPREVELA